MMNNPTISAMMIFFATEVHGAAIDMGFIDKGEGKCKLVPASAEVSELFMADATEQDCAWSCKMKATCGAMGFNKIEEDSAGDRGNCIFWDGGKGKKTFQLSSMKYGSAHCLVRPAVFKEVEGASFMLPAILIVSVVLLVGLIAALIYVRHRISAKAKPASGGGFVPSPPSRSPASPHELHSGTPKKHKMKNEHGNTLNSSMPALVDEDPGTPSKKANQKPHAAGVTKSSRMKNRKSKKTIKSPRDDAPAADWDASPGLGSEFYNKADITPMQTLGTGSYGRVFLAKKKSTGQLLAVKEMMLEADYGKDSAADTAAEIELKMLQKLTNTYIVQYYGHYLSENSGAMLIFLEYMPDGTIANELEKTGPFDNALIKKYAKMIHLGVQFLHGLSPSVVHRDLKPENLLLKNGILKLADFGCAKLKLSGTSRLQTGTTKGTIPYMPPEIYLGKESGCAHDIWSLGCCIHEMCTAQSPWSEFGLNSLMEAFRLIACTEALPTMPKGRPDVLTDFIYACLVRNPMERPKITDLGKSPFLTTP
eukprot:GEMP01026631.1.p1 GENE.GEMP01026631.1~~GEMP01026631.1.p1  ORF type:complete len:536 (+),score=104.19 GEMP01026631.1:230-1837(+)